MKYTCFVCGYRTLDSRCDWDICPICYWEDDVILAGDVDKISPANGDMRLSEAQANFILDGACSPEHLSVVRRPLLEEERDPNWRPLDLAMISVEQKRKDAHS